MQIRGFVFHTIAAAGIAAGVARADTAALAPIWEKCGIERPVTVIIPPDDSGRYFLVQQTGRVRILPDDRSSAETKTFLDISDRKLAENDFEEGLIGMAFHPEFRTNGLFYIHYSQQDPKRSVISEMRVSADSPDRADPSTERILLEIPDPFWNHNCGNLLFDESGCLVFGMGDGGKANDPLRLAQNPFDLHGKILRIDVNTRSGARPYGIPADNPFVGREGVRPEIWALGMRNPWGMWIDPETKLFWCADVGQDLWEEVNIIEKGGNYGWSFREGKQPFVLRTDPPPDGVTFIDPVIDYPRTEGTSVTGGFVYRGKRLPHLAGAYIYGDFGSGRIWALRYDAASRKVISNELVLASEADSRGQPKVKPTAFCPDTDGEVLVLNWHGGISALVPKPGAESGQ